MGTNNKYTLLKNFFVILAALVIILVILEIVIRLFLPQNLNYTMFDQNLMFKHVPNLEFRYFWIEFDNIVKFNSKGLRDEEYEYIKKEGIYRILILGDSFPAALQVNLNDTFPKILEKKLNSKGDRYEVINAGVGGYGTENQLLFFELEGIKYNPDIVILAFAMSDIDENMLSPLMSVKNDKLVRNIPVGMSLPKRFMLYCSRHLHLCAWAHNMILENLKQSEALRRFFGIVKISSKGSSENIPTRAGLDIYRKSDSTILKKALNETFLELKEMDDFASKNKIKLVILAMPHVEQVDNNHRIEFLKTHKLDDKDTDMDKFQKIAYDFAKAENIAFINPLDYLKQRNSNNSFYFNLGGHFNVNGHKVLADYIYSELKGKN